MKETARDLGGISEPPGSQGALYRRLAERLTAIAPRAIVVGESFQRYAAGATRAGRARSELVKVGKSARRAADAVRADLPAGDVVLIKSRNTQRLERIALALQGHTVGRDIPFCSAANIRCEDCPMLERGWPDPETAAIVCAPAVRIR